MMNTFRKSATATIPTPAPTLADTGATVSEDQDQAAVLTEAQATARALRREAILLPDTLAEARMLLDTESVRAQQARRLALPSEIHLARIDVLQAGVDVLRPQLDAAAEARQKVADEAADVMKQIGQFHLRLVEINGRHATLDRQQKKLAERIEHKTSALKAEQTYISSTDFDDPSKSLWSQVPTTVDEGLETLISQAEGLRSAAAVDETLSEADEQRLGQLVRDVRIAVKDVGPANAERTADGFRVAKKTGQPLLPVQREPWTLAKESILKHMRQQLAAILL